MEFASPIAGTASAPRSRFRSSHGFARSPLLGAVGYGRRHIFTIVVAENLLLLAWGLAIGAASALVAIAPAVLERGGRAPVASAGALLLVAVFFAGLISSFVATRAALRTPLLNALRSE